MKSLLLFFLYIQGMNDGCNSVLFLPAAPFISFSSQHTCSMHEAVVGRSASNYQVSDRNQTPSNGLPAMFYI